jgi:tetratricopeptide (TPR) repeat protein
MGNRRVCCKAGLLWLATGVALAAPPQYVASRRITLEFRLSARVAVDEILVWVSTDTGRSWQAAEVTREGREHVRYLAPADGRYDFYLVLRNAAGSSAAPPEPGSSPTATVVVDTLAPLIQAHDAEIERADDALRVSLRATLIEENLSETGVHLFYRDGSEHWVDSGAATVLDGRIVGSLPTCDAQAVDLRVVVADLAGNVAAADVLRVNIPEASPVQPPETQPATPAPPVEPVPPAPAPAEVKHLRELACDFMAEGRFSLAAARLEDALALAPKDADLLVELGTALYRAGRYDDAAGQFHAALIERPDHSGALDGLALVAVTQRQYPQARDYLLQLQRLRPNSGPVWLRSGDVEHRLGHTEPALAAWRKVLNAADADDSVRDGARRRLAYFGSEPAATTQPATGEPWREPPSPHPSSSSPETMSIRKRPR